MSKISTWSSKLLALLSATVVMGVFVTLSMSFTPVEDDYMTPPDHISDDSIFIAGIGTRPKKSHWTTTETSGCSTTTTYHNKNDYGKTIGQSLGNGYTTVTENSKNATATNSTATAAGSQSYVLWNTGMGGNANQDYEGQKDEGTLTVAHTNSVTFLATPSDPEEYRFAGWYSDAAGTTLLSNDNPYTTEHVIPGASYGTSESNTYQSASSPHTKTIYAKFEAIPSTSVTFLAASTPAKDKGSYTVVGKGVNKTITTSNQTIGVKSITLTATPSEATEFLNWYKLGAGDEKIVLSTENPFTTSFTEATTVGVEWRELTNHNILTFKAVEKDAYDNPVGSYTVNSTSVSTSDYVYNTGLAYKFQPTMTATPATGYAFTGWYAKHGKRKDLLSTDNPWHPTFTQDTAICAGFAFNNYTDDQKAQFKVGSTYYTDLNAANSAASSGSSKTIICTRDGVLPPGNYTISNGVTLYIPYSTSESPITKPVKINTTANATAMNAYRTLIMTDGAHITCNGTICIGGQACAGNGGSPSGYVTGDCGMIDMSAGGHIEMNGTLYCWGFIKGQDMDQGNNTLDVGTITANSGAVVWENFSVGDWRGGTATSGFSGRFFPFQSYFIQNIEIPVTYKYGSTLKNFFTFNMSSSAQETTFSLIGSGNGCLFRLTDSKSVVRKWYDPTTDLMCYELSGTAILDYISLTISYFSIKSEDYDLPINSNMHIILTKCNMTLNKPMLVQPGAVVEVKEDAKVTISTNIYMYDKDEWGPWISGKYYRSYGNAYPFLTSHKNRGDGNSNTDLDDAVFIVDGTLTISNGSGLYSSTGGANVMGNGGGKVIFPASLPSSTTIKWYKGTKTSGDGEVGTTAMNVANLCNDDASYTKAIKSTTFYNIHGRWFAASAKDEKGNHTYDFTYISSGAVSGTGGTNTTTDAVYSWDKTGLELQQKWANVTADGCTNWWHGQGGQSTYFYNWTMSSAWHQFIPTATAGLYSGSNNKIYTKTDCVWEELGETDANCLYTINGVKKALVDGQFIELEQNAEDAAFHAKDNPTQYYISFEGCNWHEATKYPKENKAYIVESNNYIWYENKWMEVEREEPFFFNYDETNVPVYYEYVGSEWIIAQPYVRMVTPLETRTFLRFSDAIAVATLKSNTTITLTLLRDFVNTANPLTYTAAKATCTLDLNGHKAEIKVVGAGTSEIKMFTINAANTTFTITDNTSEKKGELKLVASVNTETSTKRWSGIYVQNGTLIMANGNLTVDHPFTWKSNSNSGFISGILVASAKTFNLNGGYVKVEADYNPYGINAASGTPTVNINGGTLETIARTKDSPYAIVGYGTINVKGGTVHANALKSSSSRGVSVSAGSSSIGTLNMTGGTIFSEATSSAQGVYVGGTATVTGDYNATTPDNTPKARYYAKANISGGAIDAVCRTSTISYGVLSYGTTIISGGTITSTVQTSSQNTAYGVRVLGGTTTIKSGADITATAPTKAYGLSCSGANGDSYRGWPHVGDLRVEGGTITANTTNTTIAYGLYVSGTTYTLARTDGYKVFNGDYASAGTATVTGGVFNVNAKTTTATGIVVDNTVTKNAASATPVCTINGGYFKMTGTGTINGANTAAQPANFHINSGYYSHNGNLATYAVSPKHVVTLPQTDANYDPYFYKVAEAYTVTFKNGDTQLQSGYQEVGKTPVYEGETPTKPSSASESYVFDGWSTTDGGALVSPLPNVTSAGATYYAHYATTTLKYIVSLDATTNGGSCDQDKIYVEPAAAVGTPPNATKTGHTFSGWYTAASGGTKVTSATVPTGDVTYFAQFIVNSYTLTWNLDGGTVSTAGKYGSTSWPAKNATGTQTTDVPYGSTLTAPVVTRTGYTFVNWGGTVAATMPAETLTYTAVWRANTNTAYTVKHYKQDLTGGGYNEVTEDRQSLTGTTGASITPAVKSYDGFLKPTEQTTTIAADGSTVVEYHYDRVEYTINWNAYSNGGSCATPSTNVRHGATLGSMPAATKTGNSLEGWYTQAVGGVKITAETPIMQNYGMLYAQFIAVPSYTVTFNVQGHGTAPDAQDVMEGQKVIEPAAPTADGYLFGGWYKEAECTNPWNFASDVVTSSRSVFAKWTPITYTISYDLAGGSATNPTSYTIETATFTLTNPTREGYTFAGWIGTGLASATTTVTIAKGSTDDRSYTAQWTPVDYTITYNLAGGSATNPTSYTIETATFTLTNPTREGYTFAGWTGTGLDAATASISIAKGSTGNRSYTATWTINQYTIRFIDGNGNVLTNTASADNKWDYGSTPTYTGDTPTQTEDDDFTYAFNGTWSDGTNTYATADLPTVTGDKTYTAQFTATPKAIGAWLDIVDWVTNGSGNISAVVVNMNNYVPATKKAQWKVAANGNEYTKTNWNTTDHTLSIDLSGLGLNAGDKVPVAVHGVKDATDNLDSYHFYTVPMIVNNNTTLTGTGDESIVYVRKGTLTVNANATVGEIYVAPGAELLIESSKKLTVTKLLVMRTEAFTPSVLTNKGTLTIADGAQMYYSRRVADNSQYFQLGLPFDVTLGNAKLSLVNDKPAVLGTHFGIETYNAASRAQYGKQDGNWVNQTSLATLSAKTGYQMLSSSPYYYEIFFPVTYSKEIESNNPTVSVSVYTPNNGNTADQGWNYICSPFTHVYTTGLTPSGMKISELMENNKDFYQYIPERLYPAQPFYYQATAAGSLKFGNTLQKQMRRRAPESEIGGTATAEIEWLRLHYGLSDNNKGVTPTRTRMEGFAVEDQTNIFLHPSLFSNSYNDEYEAAKWSTTGERPFIYTSLAYGNLAFAALPDTTELIPLTVFNPTDGEMRFALADNDFMNRLSELWLVDMQTDEETNLLYTDYRYYAFEAGTERGRFFLRPVIRNTDVATDIVNKGDADANSGLMPRKIMIDGYLYILMPDGKVYDAVGRKVE